MSEHILVVDDEGSICTLLEDFLTDEGYDVCGAQDGYAALTRVDRDPPDLVLSDVAMPRLDGASLALELQARGIPVILISAAYATVDLPGVPFIPKPFDLDQLLSLVERTLADTRRSPRRR